ncbi:MAG: cysteine desulfurase family protein [Verrucomicrobiales bacterium]
MTQHLAPATLARVNGYFDHNATTPLSPPAREAYLEAADRYWHNPSGLYREAAASRRALEDARESLAEILSVEPQRIVFDSGATEGCNAVFRHFAAKPVAISAVEHPCVTEAAEHYCSVSTLPSSRGGVTEIAAIPEGVELVSLMAANNENGVLQPWREALAHCQERQIPFHCDASQWLGKLDPEELGRCDYLTATAHKFGGPKGVGFTLVPPSGATTSHQLGGPQEHGHRAGTEDYPAIASMIAALEAIDQPGSPQGRDQFEAVVTEQLPGTVIVGEGTDRLWNTSMLIMPDHKNLKWLTRLSARGICVSTGSACSAGKDNPSRVLLAMGFGYGEMSRALRFSSGHDTSIDDWRAAAGALVETQTQLGGGQSDTLGKISLTDL